MTKLLFFSIVGSGGKWNPFFFSATQLEDQADPDGFFTAQIETLTTYYAAPWSDLTAGSVPTGPVDAVVCSDVTTAGGSSSSGAGCITSSEIWSTGVSEVQAVATTTLDVQIQVTGVGFSHFDLFLRSVLLTTSA